jgi:CheY-like chemotaxis protein
MPLASLLLCRDPDSLRVMRRVLDDVGIPVEVCTGPQVAREMLARHKFDAVLVDCDDMHGACSVLQELRRGSVNRNCIAFAITNGLTSVAQAFQMGANFVMEKPLAADRATRVLRTARGLIESERRRYFRVPTEMLVMVRAGDGPERVATATNISSGGMAMQVTLPLPENTPIHLQFTLPGQKRQMQVRAELAWADPRGLSGLRFRHVPPKAREALLAWLEEKLEQADPALARAPATEKR